MTDVTYGAVWTAVRELANAWSETSRVQSMISELPSNAWDRAGHDAATVPSLLQGLRAGANGLFARPLLLAGTVDYLLQQPMATMMLGPGPQVDEATLAGWLEHARRVERAHRSTLAWLRSRLPGYPILRVPQLARETHLTTVYYSNSIIWPRQDLPTGRQFDDEPRGVAEALGATPEQSLALTYHARRLAGALRQTLEWGAFAEARSQLVDADLAELQNAKRRVIDRLRDDSRIPAGIYESDAYRRNETRGAIAELGSSARSYCDAFDELSNLIEESAGDVFGWLTAYGEPQVVETSRVDLPRPHTAHVVVGDPWLHHPADLVRLDDPLLPDVYQVRGATGAFDLLNLRQSTLSLRQLPGTSIWFEAS